MDENEIQEDSLTETEAEEVERGEMDGEEAHRYGEFRELRDLANDILEQLRDMREMLIDLKGDMNEQAAMAIENGAVITDVDSIDVDGDGDTDELEIDMEKWDWE